MPRLSMLNGSFHFLASMGKFDASPLRVFLRLGRMLSRPSSFEALG